MWTGVRRRGSPRTTRGSFTLTEDNDGEGSISLTHRVAAKLYIEVPGDQVEQLAPAHRPAADRRRPRRVPADGHNHGNIHHSFQEDSRLVAAADQATFASDNFTVLA